MKQNNIIVRRILIFVIPIMVLAYTFWYWSMSSQHIIIWYKSINPYLFNRDLWEADFLRYIKNQGNWWCLAGSISSLVWAYLVYKTQSFELIKPRLTRRNVFQYLIVVIIAIVLSFISNYISLYHTDEIFSANNFAKLPLFQRISYYMETNNHLLFNIINGTLFSGLNDLIFTGRLISMFCYIIVACLTFYMLNKVIKQKVLVWFSTVVMMLQFSAWGFSGQARGYELLLLFSLGAFISLINYFLQQNKVYLQLYAFCNIAGMLTIPTYLYWWTGLTVASIIYQMVYKKFIISFYKNLLASLAMLFILYMPVFSINGFSNIINNPHVSPEPLSMLGFIASIKNHSFLTIIFSEWFLLTNNAILIGILCLLIPFILFLNNENKHRNYLLVIIYLSILASFLAIAILMRKFPFGRNMIAHGYIALLIIIITIATWSTKKFFTIVLASFLGVYLILSLTKNYKRIPDHLYYSGVETFFNDIQKYKTTFAPNSSVYLDEGAFYWWYILQPQFTKTKLFINTNKASFNYQDYCIIPSGTSLPFNNNDYALIETILNYNIYKKK